MNNNLSIVEGDSSLEFIPHSDFTFEYANKVKMCLDKTSLENIIVNFVYSDFIDSTMVGIIMTAMKRKKSVIIRLRKDSYIKDILTTYGFINILNIEYVP